MVNFNSNRKEEMKLNSAIIFLLISQIIPNQACSGSSNSASGQEKPQAHVIPYGIDFRFGWYIPETMRDIESFAIFATPLTNFGRATTVNKTYSHDHRSGILNNLIYDTTYATKLEIHFHARPKLAVRIGRRTTRKPSKLYTTLNIIFSYNLSRFFNRGNIVF